MSESIWKKDLSFRRKKVDDLPETVESLRVKELAFQHKLAEAAKAAALPAVEAPKFAVAPPNAPEAKTEKKLVLLDFTGSDWCGWCIKLDKEVFSKPEFQDYAKKNLVLVELDFPQQKQQTKNDRDCTADRDPGRWSQPRNGPGQTNTAAKHGMC